MPTTSARSTARSRSSFSNRSAGAHRPMTALRRSRRPAGLEVGFELVQLSCSLTEPGVGRPFADAGQDPADGFGPASRGPRGDQRVQHLPVHGSEPDVSRGEITLRPGWILRRAAEPLPGPALVAGFSAKPEL